MLPPYSKQADMLNYNFSSTSYRCVYPLITVVFQTPNCLMNIEIKSFIWLFIIQHLMLTCFSIKQSNLMWACILSVYQ